MQETAMLRARFGSRSFSTLILVLWIFLGIPPSICGAQNLQTAWQQAAATSPEVAQARAQLEAQQAGRSIARSALLPHLEGGASGGINTAHVTGFGSQPISTGYHSDIFSASLTASVLDGQSLIAVKQADSRIRASEAALAYTEQNLELAVTEAYFGVLRAQANEHVARKQEKLLEGIDAETLAKLHVGTGDIISVREVEAQLDATKSDLIVATNAVAIAKDQLQQLTHHPVGTLQDVKTLEPIGPQPGTVAPWIAAALRNQPLLRRARAEWKESQQQVQFAKRAWWPTLTLSGTGLHSSGALLPPLVVNQVGASLNLSVPIYQGGSIRAGVRQAKALSKASQARVGAMQDQVRLETQTAFLELENSAEQFHAAQQAVRSAQTSLDATRKGFEIGSRSIIDLLTATTQLASVQRTYYLALYTQLVARVQLKAAAGVLSATDIQSINTLLSAAPSH
ncbi:MAG TPA: TolC family outer membrane protein [Acidobacteriaceae bacterium]|nr:TolC family outer membrane protein [Acidobacteriaceae bacterium]